MKHKIIGIIPARYHSTRFPAKLLALVAGKTLLQHTFENAKKINLLDELIIATDHSKIFEETKKFGGIPLLTSSACLNGTDRLAEVLTTHPKYQQAEFIVNFQGDEPCIDGAAIEQAIQLLRNSPEAVMATLATPLTNAEAATHPSIVKCVMDKQQNALYFSRSLIPGNKQATFNSHVAYYKHIGIYIYRPNFLLTYQKLPPSPLQQAEDLEQLKILEYGYRIKVALSSIEGVGVDEFSDIPKLEHWLCKQNTSL